MRKIRFKSLRFRLLIGILVFAILASGLPLGTSTVEASPFNPFVSQDITLPTTFSREEVSRSEDKLSDIRQRFSGKTGPVFVTIELQDEPAIKAYIRAKQSNASEAIQLQNTNNQRNRIQQAQQSIERAMSSANIKADVFYRHKNTFNGLAARVNAADIENIAKLPGVVDVHLSSGVTLDHGSSVPLIGAPQYWSSLGITGTNMKIGIIDSGVDYIHKHLGGPGTQAVYDSNDPKVITEANSAFPNAKVVGGKDFVGDDTTTDLPVPDPDPFDSGPAACEPGHGSHVAGTAGGLGVNADGSAYSGSYAGALPSNMRIYPGVAPGAKLYALRVIGCGATSNAAFENAVVEAIEWAIDPNDDGNFSDKLDVINMSLGMTSWGRGPYTDPATVASDNAAEAGVIVVKSSGNLGRSYYSQRRPGSSMRAIVVANSIDANDYYDGFRVDDPADIRGIYPASRSSAYNWAAAPVISANVFYLSSSQDACSPLSPADAAIITNTKPIVLIDWFLTGSTTSNCGSAARSNRLAAAGASGVIMAYNSDVIGIAIAGNALIPAIVTNLSTANLLKSKLTAGQTSNVVVTITGDYGLTPIATQSQVDTLADSSSIGVGSLNNLKPDIAAPGTSILSTKLGSGKDGVSFNGTSMASPHVAGTMALLRQQYPGWSVEELKALLMNTATDIYTGTNRTGTRQTPISVGAGRVNLSSAITNSVIAYNTDMPGNVSVSFGFLEITQTTTVTRSVKVVNKTGTPVVYSVSYDTYSGMPGVTYAFPDGNMVNVGANSSATVRVTLTANPAQMKTPLPPTIAATQGGAPRAWLPEASGMMLLTPVTAPLSAPKLRLPVFATPRPASTMRANQSTLNFAGNATNATLTLAGTSIENGTADPIAGDVTSAVSGFELQASFPMTTNMEANKALLKHVGVASNVSLQSGGTLTNTTLFFGLATHNDWLYPAFLESSHEINIDLNRDGDADYILYNTRLADGQDVFVTKVFRTSPASVLATSNRLNSNGDAAALSTPVFNNSVMVMSVKLATLGITDTTNTRFDYWIDSYNEGAGVAGDLVGKTPKFTYDWKNPGLDLTAASPTVGNMFIDAPSTQLPVRIDNANYAANKSKGILLLHFHNARGNRAEVVSVVPPCVASNVVTLAEDSQYNYCGSLSRAISEANGAAGNSPVNISFNVPGNVITLTTPLPAISSTAPVVIGAACNVGKPSLEIRAGTGANITTGLQLKTGGNELTGLALSGFTGWALEVESSSNTIKCSAFSGSGGGVRLSGDNNTLGDSANAMMGNYMYGNTGYGLLVANGSSNNMSSHSRIGYNLADANAKNMGGGLKVEVGGYIKLLIGNRVNTAS